MKKVIITLFLLVVLSFLILSGCLDDSEKEDIHEFTFTALDGSEKHLSDYRGKVVILDLWASDCPPCLATLPELKKIYESYSRDDLEIISVDVDPSEGADYIKSFIEWFEGNYGVELNWVFGMDDGSISEKYLNEGAIPTVALFDQVGRLQFRKPGICAYDGIPPGYPAETNLLAPEINKLID